MSRLSWKFLGTLPAVALTNAAIAAGETLQTVVGKLQAQINALIAREEVYSKVITVGPVDHNVSWATEFGFNFQNAPVVTLTCVSAGVNRVTVAELSAAPTTTGCTIRVYRTVAAVVLAGNPVERTGATVQLTVVGKRA